MDAETIITLLYSRMVSADMDREACEKAYNESEASYWHGRADGFYDAIAVLQSEFGLA